MESVVGRAITRVFGDDLRASCLGVFKRFQNHHSSSVRHDKPVPVLVKRPGSMFWIVISGGQTSRGLKSRQPKGRYSAFCTAANRNIRVSSLYHLCAFAYGMRACRASRYYAHVRSAKTVLHGYKCRCHVRDKHGYKERRYPARAFFI